MQLSWLVAKGLAATMKGASRKRGLLCAALINTALLPDLFLPDQQQQQQAQALQELHAPGAGPLHWLVMQLVAASAGSARLALLLSLKFSRWAPSARPWPAYNLRCALPEPRQPPPPRLAAHDPHTPCAALCGAFSCKILQQPPSPLAAFAGRPRLAGPLVACLQLHLGCARAAGLLPGRRRGAAAVRHQGACVCQRRRAGPAGGLGGRGAGVGLRAAGAAPAGLPRAGGQRGARGADVCAARAGARGGRGGGAAHGAGAVAAAAGAGAGGPGALQRQVQAGQRGAQAQGAAVAGAGGHLRVVRGPGSGGRSGGGGSQRHSCSCSRAWRSRGAGGGGACGGAGRPVRAVPPPEPQLRQAVPGGAGRVPAAALPGPHQDGAAAAAVRLRDHQYRAGIGGTGGGAGRAARAAGAAGGARLEVLLGVQVGFGLALAAAPPAGRNALGRLSPTCRPHPTTTHTGRPGARAGAGHGALVHLPQPQHAHLLPAGIPRAAGELPARHTSRLGRLAAPAGPAAAAAAWHGRRQQHQCRRQPAAGVAAQLQRLLRHQPGLPAPQKGNGRRNLVLQRPRPRQPRQVGARSSSWLAMLCCCCCCCCCCCTDPAAVPGRRVQATSCL
jgi:hypothetical protein